ncbi:MAG: histidine kinase [Bacteroidia bacterium]
MPNFEAMTSLHHILAKIPVSYRKLWIYFMIAEFCVQMIFYGYINYVSNPNTSSLQYHLLTFFFQALTVPLIWWVTYLTIQWKWVAQILFQLLFCLVFQIIWLTSIQQFIQKADIFWQNMLFSIFELPTAKAYSEDMKLMYYYLIRHTYKLIWIYAAYFFEQLKEEEEKKRALLLENKRLALENWKFRINPDFYFSTLHTIQYFEQAKHPKTPNLILSLANLMEYIIYNTQNARIFIEKEFDFLQNLMETLKIQVRKESNIQYHFSNEGFTQKVSCFLLGKIPNFFLFEIKTEKPIDFQLDIKANKMQMIQIDCLYRTTNLPLTEIQAFLTRFEALLKADYPQNYHFSQQITEQTFHFSLEIQC